VLGKLTVARPLEHLRKLDQLKGLEERRVDLFVGGLLDVQEDVDHFDEIENCRVGHVALHSVRLTEKVATVRSCTVVKSLAIPDGKIFSAATSRANLSDHLWGEQRTLITYKEHPTTFASTLVLLAWFG